jgi:hypothetical protein
LHRVRGSLRLYACNRQRYRHDPVRPGGEFFTTPTEAAQRRYEALRAYFVEDLPATEPAARVAWATETLNSAVREFQAGRRDFFVTAKPGPKSARTVHFEYPLSGVELPVARIGANGPFAQSPAGVG